MKTLIIDNYDSFTYNLVHLLATVNHEEPVVVLNDAASWPSLRSSQFDNIVISPGPGHPARPRDFGICRDVILDATIPVLGICLGLQGMVDALGGTVSRAPAPKHGTTSLVWHEEDALFAGIPSPFKAARYHSLAAQLPLPVILDKIAWTDDGLVMAIAHRERPLWGVQFHPESILMEHGPRLMENFRDLTAKFLHRRSSHRPRHIRSDSPKPPRVPPISNMLGKPARRVFYRELPVAIDTDAAFCTVFSNSRTAFWLDSASTDCASSRWSYLGNLEGPSARLLQYSCATHELLICANHSRVACRQSILDYLDQHAIAPPSGGPPCPFRGGYIGWLGYEMRSECGSPCSRRADTPDALFMRVDRFVAVDHSAQRTYIIAVDDAAAADEARRWIAQTAEQLTQLRPALPVDTFTRRMPCVDFTLNRSREAYLSDIEQCLEWIRAGESYQVCLTNEVTCPLHADPFCIYRILRCINPAPFAAFIRWPGGAVLSASPERFLQVTADRRVEARPIKGTSARSTDPDADARLAQRLSVCEKNYAENAMIVDLIRNDLSRACIPGTVKVAKLAALETYATVHQLVSTVTGQLRDRYTAIDLLRATFPGGSMTGVPKLRTLELIDQLERRPRGIYSGILGFLSDDGVADFSIVIRTIVATAGQLRIGAGGGIVAQSNPAQELDEMLLKARAPMQAITLASPSCNESHRRCRNGF